MGASAAHIVDNRPYYIHSDGRTRPWKHQQHIWWRTDHITHRLRAEQDHGGISSTHGGEQTHYTHSKGRTRPWKHQQHIWWRTDHITHILRAEKAMGASAAHMAKKDHITHPLMAEQ